MSSGVSEKRLEKAKIFETVFSSPGMKQACKIVLNPSRQTILLLSHLIEEGLTKKEGGDVDEILSFLPPETLSELSGIVEELLKKSEELRVYLASALIDYVVRMNIKAHKAIAV